MPPVAVRARFFGGPADGWSGMIDTGLLNGFRVPVRPSVAERLDADAHWLDIPVHLYCWDGTINDAGERRMRWRP